MKKLIYILPVAISIALSSAHAADLATSAPSSLTPQPSPSTLESAANKVDSANSALINIKDSSPSPVDQLTARIQVVSGALNLATKEVTDLKANLAGLPTLDPKSRESELRAQYGAELDSYLKYYKDKSAELSVLKDEAAVKSLAKEIVDFRANGYNAEIDKIADFSLLFYTGETLGTAVGRWNKIVADISKLDKLSLLKISDFGAKLSKVNDIIKDANLNYLKAQALVLAPDPIKAPDLTKNATEPTEKPATPKDLMTNSLSDIKNAYDIFLQVSREIRKTLGLSTK